MILCRHPIHIMKECEIWDNHEISFRAAVQLSKSDAPTERYLTRAEDGHLAILKLMRSRQGLRLASSLRPQVHTSGADERTAWPESCLGDAWGVVTAYLLECAHGLVPQSALRSASA